MMLGAGEVKTRASLVSPNVAQGWSMTMEVAGGSESNTGWWLGCSTRVLWAAVLPRTLSVSTIAVTG
jgi:hypothetical protein